MAVKLDEIVPLGRSRREYELMFNFVPSDYGKKILGCGDGPASFNAEMTGDGAQVISVDPLYQFSGLEIKARFEATIDDVINQVNATPAHWTWSYHRKERKFASKSPQSNGYFCSRLSTRVRTRTLSSSFFTQFTFCQW